MESSYGRSAINKNAKVKSKLNSNSSGIDDMQVKLGGKTLRNDDLIR